MNGKIFLAPLLTLGVTACGTFNLGNVSPQSGKTADQQQLDMLTCKDQATLAVNSAGRQTGDFLLGLTIVGAPAAYEMDKAKERQVFSDCMHARGYAVTLPGQTAPSPTSTAAATTAPSVPGADQLSLALPPGFIMRPAPEKLKAVGAVYYAVNGTLDIGVTVIPFRREGVTDLAAFASTRRTNESSVLKDATYTEIISLQVGGRNAVQFTVTGTSPSSGIKITFVSTFIEGHDQIVFVNAWAGTANALQQMTVLESLAGAVSGIS